MIHLVFFIDTNQLNARQASDEMNLLEKWHKDELITVVMPHSAFKEAINNNSPFLQKKAKSHIYTINDEVDDHSYLDPVKAKIYSLMEINSNSSPSNLNDADIVYDAYSKCAILVTNDGASKSQPKGILGRREVLKDFVKIVTPKEAIELVKSKLLKSHDS